MSTTTEQHTTELARALAEVLPEGRVDDSPLRLAVYARAADCYEYTPQAVARVTDEAQVRAVPQVARR